MAVDFGKLFSSKAGKAMKPPVLPMADYPVVVKNKEFGESSKKHTPYVRFFVGVTAWPDSVPDAERVQVDEDGNQFPIDLTKKQLRVDFYDDGTTPGQFASWRLDAFMRSCGIDTTGKDYAQCIEEVVGKQAMASIKVGMNQQTNEPFNEIDAQGLVGVGG